MKPYLIIFGGLRLPSYGLMAMAGALIAFFLVMRLRKKSVLSEDNLLDAFILAVVLGLIGAKALYLVKSPQPFPRSLRELWDIISAGLVFYGGLLGGLLGVALAARKTKKPFLAFTDVILPAFCFAHACGRIGCLLAGCCFGVEREGALCVVTDGVSRLAVQPMEAAFLVLLGLFLTYLFLKKRPRRGVVTGLYMTLYAVWRFIIEFYRADDRGFVGALSTSQFIGVFVFAAGAALLIASHKNRPPSGAAKEDLVEFEELAAYAEKMTPEERLSFIRREAETLVPALAAVSKDGETGLNVYASFLFTALAADNRLTREEYALIEPALPDFFGEAADYETAKKKAESCPDGVAALKEEADRLIDILGESGADLKKRIVLTSLLLTAADGSVSEEEKQYLKQLMA